MEHIYTIKVKRQFDPRGQYPSERRYSASTVFGFAWVHLALGVTCFLLACLALYNPNTATDKVISFNKDELFNAPSESIFNEDISSEIDANSTISPDNYKEMPIILKVNEGEESIALLVLSPCLLALGAFIAGFAAIVAWRKWYLDHSITWFFLSSVFSTLMSIIALCLITTWIMTINENGLRFMDYFTSENIFTNTHFEVSKSSSEYNDNNKTIYYVVAVPLEELRNRNIPLIGEEKRQDQTRKVLSINILIATIVEIIWSILGLKIAWDGMRANYPDDDAFNNRGSNTTVQVVSEIKGNNTKHLPKNTKILPPQPDLIEHYPKDNKIKKFFQNQQENGGYFLNTNPNENGLLMYSSVNDKSSDFPRRESSSEYKERMLNFLNRCAESGRIDSPDSYIGFDPGSLCASEISHTPVVNQEDQKSVNIRLNKDANVANNPNRLSNISWGDSHDHKIYDQNTLDLDKIVLRIPSIDIKKTESNDNELEQSVSNIVYDDDVQNLSEKNE